MKILLVIIAVIIVSGCGGPNYHLNSSLNEYKKVSGQIELGDMKENVLSILLPIQKALDEFPIFQKLPEKYIKDNVLVEVYFMKSSHQYGSPRTDDQFTPYVFNNGKLVGIGWAILGGASLQGQSHSPH